VQRYDKKLKGTNFLAFFLQKKALFSNFSQNLTLFEPKIRRIFAAEIEKPKAFQIDN